MLDFISEIKKEMTGNGELTSLERKTWEVQYKLFEKNSQDPNLLSKTRMNMISFIGGL